MEALEGGDGKGGSVWMGAEAWEWVEQGWGTDVFGRLPYTTTTAATTTPPCPLFPACP